MQASASRSLTVRLKPDLLAAAARLAKKREMSLNSLIQESIARQVKEQEDRELFEAFEAMGSFQEDSNVEYAIHAQAEVMLHD